MCWVFYTQQSLGFTQNGDKSKKNKKKRTGCAGGKVLLMRKVSEEWVD